MFDFWYESPVIIRVVLALVLMGVSVVAFFAGRIWIAPGAIGLVLLLFCGAGKDSGGYNF